MTQPAPARPRAAIRRVARIVLGAGLLAALALAARGVPWGHVLAMMAGMPASALALAAVASLTQALVLATRLWTVFPHSGRPTWVRVARAYGFGQLTNACLPGRAGDVLKVVTMRDDRSATATDAAGVVLADKALDLVTLCLLVVLLAPALLLGVLAGAVHAGWIAALAAGAAVAGVAVLRKVRPTAFTMLRDGAAATWRSLRGLASPWRLAIGLTLGCAAWLAEATAMMVLAHPLGVPLTLPQAVGGLLALNLGIAIPVSVGNVGAYEAAIVVGLSAFGATVPQGLAIGTLHHAVQLFTVILFALVFWVRDRLAKRSVCPAVTDLQPAA